MHWPLLYGYMGNSERGLRPFYPTGNIILGAPLKGLQILQNAILRWIENGWMGLPRYHMLDLDFIDCRTGVMNRI